MLDLLKLRFICLNRNITLQVFAVTDQLLLDNYKTNDSINEIAGFNNLPGDSYRLLDEEIKGEEEYNAGLESNETTPKVGLFSEKKEEISFGSANFEVRNQNQENQGD